MKFTAKLSSSREAKKSAFDEKEEEKKFKFRLFHDLTYW